MTSRGLNQLNRLRSAVADIADDHAGALPSKGESAGTTHSCGAAGDQHGLVGELHQVWHVGFL